MSDKQYDNINELSKHLWGKTNPYETIYSHSQKVATVTEVLSEFMPQRFQIIAQKLKISQEEAIRLTCYLAGVHDIGKIIPVWQGQEHAPERELAFYWEHTELLNPEDLLVYQGYRHERGGFSVLMRIWTEKNLFQTMRIRRNLAAVVMTHHQKLAKNSNREAPGTTKEKSDGVCAREWMDCQEALEQHYREEYSVRKLSIDGSNLDVPCMIMSGLLVLADWMGSSLGAESCETEKDRKLFKETLRAFISQMGLCVEQKIPDSFQLMWPWIESPRPLQKVACEIVQDQTPMLTIIEDSMGTGKTEAALFVANHVLQATGGAGIYVALPTSATANQMHQRVDELLGRFEMNGARLLHGTAWLSAPIDRDEISDAERFLAPTRMGLFAPYGVGTIDQVLQSILKTRFGNLRMTGISGKILIIDEVHAYDAYMTQELKLLLQWCKAMEVPVIMLSATLTDEKRKDFISAFSSDYPKKEGYPRITTVDKHGALTETLIRKPEKNKTYRISVQPLLNQIEAIAELAMRTVENGGTLCVNVNTIKRARKITEYLDRITSDTDIFIFHSGYSMARRRKIEEDCVRLFGKDTSCRPRKSILVATQVVEQSLDIDFDYYITDICPIDLVLQRMGRQFRHEGVQRPCNTPMTVVLTPAEGEGFGGAEYVYDQFILEKTGQLLESIDNIVLPDDIQRLVGAVYCAEPYNDSESDTFFEMIAKNQVQKSATDDTAFNPPGKFFQFGKSLKNGELFESEAKTRLAEPSVRIAVLPESLYDKVIEDRADREEQRLAYEYSFTIRDGKLDLQNAPEGERLLKGIYLIKGTRPSYGPEETAEGDGIRMDSRYGVMITRGK